MDFNFNVHMHNHPAPELQELFFQGSLIMSILQELQERVAANTSITESAITLIGGLKAKLDEAIASGNPAELQALSDTLAAEDAKLAAAVTANTPAADPAPAPTADPTV